MAHLIDLRRGEFQARSELPDLIAKVGEADELVGGHPVLYAISEMLAHEGGVIAEGLRSVAIRPSTLEPCRCIPVEERDVGCDVVREQLVDNLAVVVETFGVHRSLAGWKHA